MATRKIPHNKKIHCCDKLNKITYKLIINKHPATTAYPHSTKAELRGSQAGS